MNNSFKFISDYINEFEIAFDNLQQFHNFSIVEKQQYFLDCLNEQIRYAISYSPFYTNLYKNHQSEIATLDDLKKLPMVTKADLKSQGASFMAISFNEILKYGETTGTSGKPVGANVHRKNWIGNSVSLAYLLSKTFDSNDVVAIAIPYELSFAAQDIDSAFQIINSTIISTGSLSKVCPWPKTLDILHRLPVNTLICSPTRMIRLATLAEERGLDSQSDFSLNKLVCVGEAFSPAKARLISKIWRNASTYSCYGTTETNALAVTCSEQNFHCIEERFYFEIIDPVTQEYVNDGETGELVISSLDTIAMPLIRYRTGDIVKRETTDCKCGLKTSVLKHYGRMGDELFIGKNGYQVVDLEDSLLEISNIGYLFCFEQKGDSLNIYLEGNQLKFNTIKDQFFDNLSKTDNRAIYRDYLNVLSAPRDKFVSLIDNSLKPGNALVIR